MAWFYNFNFNEDEMYCMPIADMFPACKHRRNIVIRKEDDTIPRSTDPYVEGHIVYRVHEFPETVYKRCFWMSERNDKKAEEIRKRYLEARARVEETEMKQRRKEHDMKWEIYQLRQRVDILEQNLANTNKTINNILATQLEEMKIITILTNGVAELIKEREEKK